MVELHARLSHISVTTIHDMYAKSDAFSAYLEFESWLKTQHDAPIKRLHSDRGGEYLSDEFSRHLKRNRMEQKLTTHDTPKHNSIAEQLN